MTIKSRAIFAKECVLQGLRFGVNSHYLIAVAELRSGIEDDADGDKIGPYRLTQAAWDALAPHFLLRAKDISRWRRQCIFTANAASRAQSRLLNNLGRFPSAIELYQEQWRDDSVKAPQLRAALNSTADLIGPAVSDVLGDPSAEPDTISNVSAPVGTAAEAPDEARNEESSQPDTTTQVVKPTLDDRWYMTEEMVKLLGMIRSKESGDAAYNADYRNDDKWILTDKTFDEVRKLGRSQVSEDREASSAIGAYQFLTKTLNSLKQSLDLTGQEVFNEAFQDDLAVALMIRRGLMKYLHGTISAENFANNLAKEWASLPVVTRIQGQRRIVNPGQSFYAGDGLNKAFHSPKVILDAVIALKMPQAFSEGSGDETDSDVVNADDVVAEKKPNVDGIVSSNNDFERFFNQNLADVTDFKWHEFLVKGDRHATNGLNTDPPIELWPNVVHLARVLQKFRNEYGGHPVVLTSVYRSPKYNAAVGGAKGSQHKEFRAADFKVVGKGNPTEWAAVMRTIRAGKFFSGGIGLYNTFVHVDTRGQDRDWRG